MGKYGKSIPELKDVYGSLNDNDVFEIAIENDDNYISRKCSYGKLKDSIVDASVVKFQEQIAATIDDISNSVGFTSQIDSKLCSNSEGGISFNSAPTIINTLSTDESLQSREQIIDLINEKSNYILSSSYVNFYPHNDEGYTEKNDDSYILSIDSGRYQSNEIIVNDGGYLTLYGWMTSPVDIQPQNAWVGLFGEVKTGEDEDRKYVLLQICPWIVGTYSSKMQYVGFNIPVQPGLKLKIISGFPVNGNTSGYQTADGHNLMMVNEGNTPNTFIGYVVQ